ncbi:hypothetical protein HGRIS_012061 [Hohenbuehelia grisea]|uniref:Arf-GAP domain-containing protein n=1 Tax=Hohenbuehelia grisea TaxID=104357 RepID=A0ABR3IR62_9AGAR
MSKISGERNQRAVLELAAKPGNNVCADCKASMPRWASHSLGIFICVNCASIHRKLGTHVSKVKHLTMDEWTKEQVENMRQNGNVKSNAHYNPNEARHPPPTSMTDVERDSELEQFIRSKYQYKRFIDKSAVVASHLGPSRSLASQQSRAVSAGPPQSAPASSAAGLGINRPSTSALPSTVVKSPPTRSVSHPLVSSNPPPPQNLNKPLPPNFPPQPSNQGTVWNDLVSLQAPAVSASLPLQVQAPSAQQQQFMNQPLQPSGLSPYSNLSVGASAPASGFGYSSGGISPMSIQPTGAGGFPLQQSPPSMFAPTPAQMAPNSSFVTSMSGSPAPQFSQPQGLFQPQGQMFTQQTMLNQSPVSPHQQFSPPQPFLQPSPQPGLVMQQGFVSGSPQPQFSQPMMQQQAQNAFGAPQNVVNSGMGMGMQMQMQMQPPPVFGQGPMPGQQQLQPQGNQFTAWMQTATPGQQTAFQGQFQGQQQQWGGM